MFYDTYIAVHGGAGAHSRGNEEEVKAVLRLACQHALQSTNREKTSALGMVEDAISILEDDPHLNAGFGSNLTLNGTVECDAAIMDGSSGNFGSVGAVSGIKNPIRLARSVIDYSLMPDNLGRIPPLTLVSQGAHAFALSQSATARTVPPESLISPRANDEWVKWKSRSGSTVEGDEADLKDTVGAVVWHQKDGIAAGVSSGGILLKHPGRIGEAAVFGAGCWAQQYAEVMQGMACSISGAGEHIIRAMLARSIGDAFNRCISKQLEVDPHEILRRVLVEDFWEPCRNRGVLSPDAGVLLLTTEDDGEGKLTARLWCAFTTPSMAVAYASSKNPKAKSLILRRPKIMKSASSDEPQIFITAISL